MGRSGPDLSDIALFVEVARRLNFSRAAEALGLSTSSLSRRVTRLEKAVGMTLFHRSSRRVELTAAGRVYFERCTRIVDEAALAHEQLTDGVVALKGVVRMSIPVDFGLLVVAPALDAFSRLHPGIGFEIDMSPQRVDLVAGGFDLAIRVGLLDDAPALVVRRLVQVEVGLYASPAYLSRAGTPGTPPELGGHQCLRVLLPDAARSWELHAGAATASVRPGGRFAVNNQSMLRQLVLAGHGIGVFDALLVAADVGQGRLLRVLPQWSMQPLAISVVTPGRRHPARVREWIEFLAARLESFDCPAPAS